MDQRIQAIIDYVAEKYKLDNYYLKRHHIFSEDTSYILNMEWFPNDAEITSEDYSPAGTLSMDVDIHTKLLRRIIFVNGVNVTEASFPQAGNTELAIEWIEQETGLEFGRQFKIVHEEEKELHFQAAVDNIAVFPSGSIDIEFNEQGKLSLFSIDGSFPDEEQLSWEPFALTEETIEPISRTQLKLLEIPVEEEEKWRSVYATTTIFVTNDGQNTISYEQVESPKSLTSVDIILEWDASIDEPFERKDFDLSLEVSPEEAFAKTKNTDRDVLTENDQIQVQSAVLSFLQREYPQASGKWKMTGIWSEKDYIFAELKPAAPSTRVIDRKIRLIIDPTTYEAINYMDNYAILDLFNHFKKADDPKISKEEAFTKLSKHIEVTPVYVYDKTQNRYVLCGKVDCGYGVDSVTGEIILLDEL